MAATCLVAVPFAPTARADGPAASTEPAVAPNASADPGLDAGSPPDSLPGSGSSANSSPNVGTDPPANELDESPLEDSAGWADTSPETPANDSGPDGGGPANGDGSPPASSETQSEPGSSTDIAPAGVISEASTASSTTSNAATLGLAATPVPAAIGVDAGADIWIVPDIWKVLTGGNVGIGTLLARSQTCAGCYGVRLGWLGRAQIESQNHMGQSARPKASNRQWTTFGWARDPLTAQLLRLLGGGGGGLAFVLIGLLLLPAAIVFVVPEGMKAFRILAVTWRPSLYFRPLELPG